MRKVLFASLVSLAVVVTAQTAKASAYNVGLGVAAGADLQRGEIPEKTTKPSWGFFVDIPLMQTFYITPQTTIYEVDGGIDGKTKTTITDIDLNFKFLVPIDALTLGAGISAGVTTGFGDYQGHYGLLGYVGFNVVANLDAFAMLQFKRVDNDDQRIDNYHGFVGGMWKFQ